jgi:hypothetical protein
MQSSSASIWISIKLIHHHYNTGLALRHNSQAGSTVLVLLYVSVIKLEARYSSCFTSQQSRWKQDTRLALRHGNQAGRKILILLYVTTIKLEARY